MKWKKILTGTLAAAMLFSNASVANLTALAKETAVVSLESARETLGTLMNEAIEKVNIEKDGIKCRKFIFTKPDNTRSANSKNFNDFNGY